METRSLIAALFVVPRYQHIKVIVYSESPFRKSDNSIYGFLLLWASKTSPCASQEGGNKLFNNLSKQVGISSWKEARTRENTD